MDINNLLSFDPESTSKVGSGVLRMETYPATMNETPSDFIDRLTTPDFNYDYSLHDTANSSYQAKSFWEELSTPVVESGEYVWDTATGAWETVKDTAVSTATNIVNAVDSAGTKIAETTGSIFDSILTRIVLIFAVLVIGLVFLGRSGVLGDIAKIFVVAKS